MNGRLVPSRKGLNRWMPMVEGLVRVHFCIKSLSNCLENDAVRSVWLQRGLVGSGRSARYVAFPFVVAESRG